MFMSTEIINVNNILFSLVTEARNDRAGHHCMLTDLLLSVLPHLNISVLKITFYL